MNRLNRDIKVSVLFTFASFIIMLAMGIHGAIGGGDAMFTNMLYYGIPFAVLAILFSRTAERKNLDAPNQTAITWSFKFAVTLTLIGAAMLIVSFII